MGLDELNCRYRDLKGELEAAYGEQVWDADQIDRIAKDLHDVEMALGMLQARRMEERKERAARSS